MGQAIDDTGADRISDGREHDGECAADILQRRHGQGAAGQDDVRAERDQSRSLFYSLVGVVLGPASVDPHIAANIPAQFLQALVECCKSILTFRVVGSPVHEDTDPPKTFGRLRARRERQRRRRAAEQRDERAALNHSMTSSARASKLSGTVRPSALAVLRLITSSYLVGACTGRSAGFSPLRMRST